MLKTAEPNTITAGYSAHTVLRMLYERGPSSQIAMARELGITKAACNQHFQRLMEENYIVEAEQKLNPRGRPSQVWQINAAHNILLGLMVEDDQLAVTLTDFNGELLYCVATEIHDYSNQTELLQRLGKLLRAAIAKAKALNARLLQGFAAVPGLIDPDGLMVNCANLPALNGLNLDEWVREHYHLPLFADSCGYAYIAGECRHSMIGSTVLLINWSKGIGVAIVCNGEALQWPAVSTKRFRGLWDFGHMRVEKNGVRCHCGKTGCLEAYLGGQALAEHHPELGFASGEALLQGALSGNCQAAAVLREAAAKLADYLEWTIELFGIDTVIFTGTLAAAYELYRAAFEDRLHSYYTDEEFAEITVRSSGSSVNTARLGAALMARHFYLYPQNLVKSRGMWKKYPRTYGSDTILPSP